MIQDGRGFLGEPKGDEVKVVPYDPAWQEVYRQTEPWLREALGEVARRVDHVGSTAVPGLEAKPVVDVQVSVPELDDEASYRSALESLGLVLRYRDSERRFFRPPEDEPRTLHIHVCESGGVAERNHLLFAAYLRTHAERRAEYGDLKRTLARRFRYHREGYLSAKQPFIQKTLEFAERWQSRTREPL